MKVDVKNTPATRPLILQMDPPNLEQARRICLNKKDPINILLNRIIRIVLYFTTKHNRMPEVILKLNYAFFIFISLM